MFLTYWFQTGRNVRENAQTTQKMSVIAHKSKSPRQTRLHLAECGAVLSGLLAGVAAYAQAPSISSQAQIITAGGGGNAAFAVAASSNPPLVYRGQSKVVAAVNATEPSTSLDAQCAVPKIAEVPR